MISHRCCLSVAALLCLLPMVATADDGGWAYYGGDQGGQRFSAARQITPSNVTQMSKAWTYSTGDVANKSDAMKRASFEDTPILADERLYVCSPFNEVSALDPDTGKQIWRFDPKLDLSVHYPNDFVCRGVAFWRAKASGVCAARIFLATNDRRLIALDAATGKPCTNFGHKGVITLKAEPRLYRRGEIQSTSAPLVSHGIVVVGSSIDDNQRVDEVRGTVHAFDAITGAPKWSFDPLANQRAPFAEVQPTYGRRSRPTTPVASSIYPCRAQAQTSGAAIERATATMRIR